MLTYEAATDAEREEFLALLRTDAGDYLEPTLQAMGATWDALRTMTRTVGEVRTVRRENTPVGYVWTELRGRELHIHGIVVRPETRGRGLGAQVFRDLEEQVRGCADLLELGVHEANARALRLYERLGFRVEKRLPDIRFAILRKPLQPA